MSTKPRMREILIPRGVGNVKKADIRAAIKYVMAQRPALKVAKSKHASTKAHHSR